MKICFLLSTFTYDGIKRSVVHFANCMQAMGHEVWVCVLHEWAGRLSLRPELQVPKERIISWEGLGQGRREWAIYQFFRQQRFDVIHANTVKMNHLGRWIGWLARVPCVIASEDNLCLKRSWKTRLEDRLLAHLCDGVVMISNEVAKSFLEAEHLPHQKVSTIYYGLPIENLRLHRKTLEELAEKRIVLNLAPAPTVVCAARLHFSKSLDTLIHAARLVVDRIGNVQFILAGDGDERRNLESLRNRLQLRENFHFIGARSDIYEIFQLADVVTLCSLWEGLGFSLMEAMAFAKPLVGTDVAGINEIIQHGRNGLLVPPQSPEKLADALLQLLLNRELAQKMGQEGPLVLSEQFDIAKNSQRLLELYQKILSRKMAL